MFLITPTPLLSLGTSYKNAIVIIRKHPVSNEEQLQNFDDIRLCDAENYGLANPYRSPETHLIPLNHYRALSVRAAVIFHRAHVKNFYHSLCRFLTIFTHPSYLIILFRHYTFCARESVIKINYEYKCTKCVRSILLEQVMNQNRLAH